MKSDEQVPPDDWREFDELSSIKQAMEAHEMAFPETWREFADWWSINDSKQVYSNGVDFLPMHRIEQMMEHYYEPVMKANKKLTCAVMTLEKEFADWKGQYDPTDAHVRMLQEENELLRGIVADLQCCSAWETDKEGWCEDCKRADTENGGCKVPEIMKRLGIRVKPQW